MMEARREVDDGVMVCVAGFGVGPVKTVGLPTSGEEVMTEPERMGRLLERLR